MTHAPKIVTIFGGSGFIGRYITRRMAKAGWRVRVAVRFPNEAIFVKTYGGVGQVDPILANVRNEASVRAAITGAGAVINCVGILQENRRQKFNGIHVEAAGRIAQTAAQEGVQSLVHVSAIGADPGSDSNYGRTKAEGEIQVQAAFPDAVILRPSVVFGPEDKFFNRFATLAQFSPVIPLVGATTRFQPVYVDDVAKAAANAVTKGAAPGVYELGGPQVETFGQLIDRMLASIRRQRLKLNVPFFIAGIDARILDFMQKLSMGMFTNTILTADQVKQLRHDCIVGEGAKTLADLGVEATSMEAVLDEYLYCHRPYGQYSAQTDSGKNLG
jgi:uncharacterized protein YbjT (DUF2867 family)